MRRQETISVIIPALNEEENIASTLSGLIEEEVEVIVVDGGSSDRTASIAREYGAEVISAPTGRTGQMNKGARKARGEIFLFLHSDSRLPKGFSLLVRECLARKGVVGGAFSLQIDAVGTGLRFIEKTANRRASHLQLPYGDQAIFLSAATFGMLDGFREIPIMEDLCLVRELQKRGRIALLPQKVLTSGRRWQHLGVFRTTLINQLLVFGFFLGVAPDLLARLYYGSRQGGKHR